MSRSSAPDARRWRARPVMAALIRAVVFAVPLGVSMLVGIVVGRVLPAPTTTPQLVGWWAVILTSATVAVIATDRWARLLLPLATLVRLSMLFPDEAPSRLKVARRVAGSKAIAAELDRAHHHGVTGTRQQAAETILALVGALGEYDSRTRGHSERTQLFVTMLAEELHLRDEDRGRLMWAALVHDIGKLKVPAELLNKPAAPTDDEWKLLHQHPMEGAQLCEPLREWLGEWWHAIEEHHERFDGTGYPQGLQGHEISYGARIVAVADSYEVMTAPRPYKLPMSPEAAREELARCAGAQFDPDVVRAFLNISIGRTRRVVGPLAWIAQVLMVRPGPLLGNVLGVGAGVASSVAAVVTLSLVPGLTDAAAAQTHRPGPATSVSADADLGRVGPVTPTNTASTTPTAGTSTNDPTGRRSPTGPTTSTRVPTETSSTRSANHPTTGSTPRPPVPTPPHPGDTTPTPTRPTTSTPPTADPPPPPPPAPVPMVAHDDAFTVLEDVAERLDVTANDTVGDHGPVTLVAASSGSHGSATITADQQITYTPRPDDNGQDSFTYTLQDRRGNRMTATASITLAAVNDPPVARSDAYAASTIRALSVSAGAGVLANDTDVDGDTLRVASDDSLLVDIRADGSIRYLPVLPGVVTVHYVVSDGHTTASGTVRITVTLLRAGGSDLVQPMIDALRLLGVEP